MKAKILYTVAVSRKEAEEVACLIGHERRCDAEAHLAEVKAPPTDPHYAAQYRVWVVRDAGPLPALGSEPMGTGRNSKNPNGAVDTPRRRRWDPTLERR